MDFEALGLNQAAERLAGTLIQLGVHQPRCAVDDDRCGAQLFGAGSGLKSKQATTDGDRVDFAAELLAQLGDGLVNGPDVLEGAVNVGVLGTGGDGGEPGCVGTRSHYQVVVFVLVAGGGEDALGHGVDLHGALAGDQSQGFVVPHGCIAQGEVHAGFREGLAQRNAVVREVCLFGQHRNLPTFKSAIEHGVGETVGSGAAADDDDAARVLCT